MKSLAKFLERNSSVVGRSLPLVHSTRAYFLKKIIETKKIDTLDCEIFKEKLNYFFVGKPAYKWVTDGEAAEWELPVCFVFEYDIHGAKRIFPFDSGGYDRFPSNIKMINRDEYELSEASKGPEKIIGTFFASPREYFFMRPRPEHSFNEEFLVDVFDSEVKAVHKLMLNSNTGADDRRCCIEVQFDNALEFKNKKPIAIIAPDVYLEHDLVKNFVKSYKLLFYPYSTYSLNSAAYFAQIYDYVRLFYEKKGYL